MLLMSCAFKRLCEEVLPCNHTTAEDASEPCLLIDGLDPMSVGVLYGFLQYTVGALSVSSRWEVDIAKVPYHLRPRSHGPELWECKLGWTVR